VCYAEPMVVNHGVMLSQWSCIMMCYVEPVVVNMVCYADPVIVTHGVLC
jgi:hypothetical protein